MGINYGRLARQTANKLEAIVTIVIKDQVFCAVPDVWIDRLEDQESSRWRAPLGLVGILILMGLMSYVFYVLNWFPPNIWGIP